MGPGLITFDRMPRLANSAIQVRTKETNAAFVAEDESRYQEHSLQMWRGAHRIHDFAV